MATERQLKMEGTKDVIERHVFDVGNLQDYMAANVDGFSGDLKVLEFKGGQSNPTYMMEAGGKKYAMRRKPPGVLLPSAHAVDREYRVMTALWDTPVPVPKTYCLCTDEDVVGTWFFIMDCVEGRVVWDTPMPDEEPARRLATYDSMCESIAALHQVDYKAVGLGDFGREGAYVARQINRWTKQYKASETEFIQEFENLIEWLPAHLPESDATTVIHGDFRLDNVILHPTEPRVVAIIDWELSTLGDPLADFNYHCMQWYLPEGFVSIPDLAAYGLPTLDEHVENYCRRTGRDGIGNWEFYSAYNLFRLAGICQGIAGRVRDGTAASPNAMESAMRVRPLSEAAWAIVEGIEAKGVAEV